MFINVINQCSKKKNEKLDIKLTIFCLFLIFNTSCFPPILRKKYSTVRNFFLKLGWAGVNIFSRKYRPLYDYLQTK